MTKAVLDARYLLCPLPVIRTQEKVKTLSNGDMLEVIGTDPGVMQDIPAWCRISGHKIVELTSHDDDYVVLLEVGNNDPS